MYLNDGGASWTTQSGWQESGDHCEWEGVMCSAALEVEALTLDANALIGPYPTDLGNLNKLANLYTASNALTGTIPDDVCTKSTSDELFISADAMNCPNDFDTSIGQYLAGCCDSVLVNVDIYLSTFASTVLRDSNCANLAGTESSVCDYMSNKVNHDIFTSGYPTDFAGDVWSWLKVRRRGHAGIVIDVLAACV